MVTLTRVQVLEGAEQNCGGFAHSFGFKIDGTGPGIILQHITRKYVVQLHQSQQSVYGGTAAQPPVDASGFYSQALTPPQINSFAGFAGNAPNAADEDYWEAWFIPANGNRPVEDDGTVSAVNDTFSAAPVYRALMNTQNTTKGTFRIVGKATYYPLLNAGPQATWTQVCARLGLVVGAVAAAGRLPASTQDPQTANGQVWNTEVDLANCSNEECCEIVVEWDSTVVDAYYANTQPQQYGETQIKVATHSFSNAAAAALLASSASTGPAPSTSAMAATASSATRRGGAKRKFGKTSNSPASTAVRRATTTGVSKTTKPTTKAKIVSGASRTPAVAASKQVMKKPTI